MPLLRVLYLYIADTYTLYIYVYLHAHRYHCLPEPVTQALLHSGKYLSNFSHNQGNAESIRKLVPLEVGLLENVAIGEQRLYLTPSRTPFFACGTGR